MRPQLGTSAILCPWFREPQEDKEIAVISIGLDKIDLLCPHVSHLRMIAEASTLSRYVVMDVPYLDKLLIGCKDSLFEVGISVRGSSEGGMMI